MADDIVYDDPGWPTQIHGHTASRGFLESTWRAVPDLTFELIDGSLSFGGAAFYELREGKISKPRVVWAVAAVMRQLGVLFAAGWRLVLGAHELLPKGLPGFKPWDTDRGGYRRLALSAG